MLKQLPKILEECKEYFPKLKAIAVTNAPGLSVTLMEGVIMAKALALSLELPLIAVNHLKGTYIHYLLKKKRFFLLLFFWFQVDIHKLLKQTL